MLFKSGQSKRAVPLTSNTVTGRHVHDCLELATKQPKGLFMNPHATKSLNIFRTFKGNRSLIVSLVRREVVGRYKGSALGLLWSFFNPVLMLVVYTFVFSVVFKARWAGGSDSKTEFALVLFTGLVVFNLFSECVNRAPGLILSNANYVKKVIFPLEILPIVAMGSAAFHFLASLAVWLIFHLIFFGLPPLSIAYLPIALLPLILFTLGLSWFLASLGVYLRDVSQIIGVLTTILLFMSPIFYPVAALPEAYQPIMQMNPLTGVIEQVRNVMIWGKGLDWVGWVVSMIASGLIAWLGFSWFQKTRKGFADVL
jgi:lipopolysaccharide transport system permease protein